MKKKLMLLAIALVLLVTPVFAAPGGVTRDNSFGIGLNLGTNTGVALRFGMGDFDLLANVGFSVLSGALGGDVAASYNVYTIDGGRGLEFPITVGVGAAAAINFNADLATNLAVIVPVGIEYNFDQISDVPITVYLRLAPGVNILSASKLAVGFGWAAYLGAIWNF